MPDPNLAALEFLLNRRSRPAKTLTSPVPDNAALEILLTAAARTPDHGKLEPWRFIVLNEAALRRLGPIARARGAALKLDAEKVDKGCWQFENGQLAVAVIGAPVASEKVPELEQVLSAGAVCLALLNAALAAGWGANWLSGWATHDRGFMDKGLGLAADEFIAGLIHIGSETSAPPDRPRPDINAKTTWVTK